MVYGTSKPHGAFKEIPVLTTIIVDELIYIPTCCVPFIHVLNIC